VFGAQITGVHESTATDRQPAVAFGFTATGASAFRRLTATIANRGSLDSTGGEVLFQHFAIALGDQLLTVPYIDFRVYPDGISSSGGAEVSGSFTVGTARRLALTLNLPALPLRLELTGLSS
jgi:preprotein translocase subunit SecD